MNRHRNSYALCTPPSPSSAFVICPDHCATSSSRRVRSLDWNLARIRIEYSPAIGHQPASSQGLKISTPSSTKSFVLRVTNVRLCSRAVAAMSPSAVLRGIPFI